jgi:hypothetical protein
LVLFGQQGSWNCKETGVELKIVPFKCFITIGAGYFHKIAIELEMLMKVFNRFKCLLAVVTRHAFWTMIFDMVIELKQVVRMRFLGSNWWLFVIVLKVHFAAMTLFKIRNQLFELLMLDFLKAFGGLAGWTLIFLAALTNNFFATHAFLKI